MTLVPDNNARMGYLPGADGNLQYLGVAPDAAPLLALWPVANGPELGNGIVPLYLLLVRMECWRQIRALHLPHSL